MKWSLLAAALAVLAAVPLHAPPADACGVKLVVKTSTPRRVVVRSANPSHMLLLGSAPHRLERELADGGHDVEVAADVSSAKRPDYAVVVTDSAHADAARAKFVGSVVIVRSGDVSTDIASIEGQLARSHTPEARTVVAARTPREPIASGSTTEAHTEVAAKPQVQPVAAGNPVADQPVADKPAPPPPPPAEKPHTAVETSKPIATATEVKTPSFHEEFFFGLGSYGVESNNATLARAVKWLTANPDLHVVVEGYADPSGGHDANMVLSQKRAETVRDALIGMGVSSSRLEVVPFGDTRLKYGQADGRNRRVAITVAP